MVTDFSYVAPSGKELCKFTCRAFCLIMVQMRGPKNFVLLWTCPTSVLADFRNGILSKEQVPLRKNFFFLPHHLGGLYHFQKQFCT